jgi:predicted CXXCH cytochrome family protein
MFFYSPHASMRIEEGDMPPWGDGCLRRLASKGARKMLTDVKTITVTAGTGLAVVTVLLAMVTGRAADIENTPARSPSEVYTLLEKAMQVESGQQFFKGATFVGSQACTSCHQKEVAEWHQTWHSKMEQWPSPETVLGEFDNQIITYADVNATDDKGKTEKVTYQVRTHREGNEFFFTVLDKDNPKNNQTYKIAKTLGGKWDQGYEVQVGDNYIPAMLRYSVKNKGWLVRAFFPQYWVIADGTPDGRPRRPEELPGFRMAEAKCAGCHTTGFTYSKDTQSGLWKARPHEGGVAEIGVACEQCHGPASKHVQAAEAAKAAGKPLDPANRHIVHMLKDLDFNQQTQVCGQCHGRGTNKTISDLAFPLGFRPGDRDITDRHRFWSYSGSSNPDEYRYVYPNDWAKRNRQQWQDYTKSAHFNRAEMSCVTCHTFHGKWEDAQLRMKPQELCVGCHNATGDARRPNAEMYAGSPMEQAGVTCINCHMPRIAFRSTQTAKTNRLAGDGSSHTFMTATPHLKKSSDLRSACESCHTKGVDMLDDVYASVKQEPYTNDELIAKMDERKASVRAAIKAVQKALSGWEPATAEAKTLVDQANAKINIVVLDGSDGLHNFKKTMALLEEALRLANAAAVVSGHPPTGGPREARSISPASED